LADTGRAYREEVLEAKDDGRRESKCTRVPVDAAALC
jgi:hypothetical protein